MSKEFLANLHIEHFTDETLAALVAAADRSDGWR
jgi:hypothetical protein